MKAFIPSRKNPDRTENRRFRRFRIPVIAFFLILTSMGLQAGHIPDFPGLSKKTEKPRLRLHLNIKKAKSLLSLKFVNSGKKPLNMIRLFVPEDRYIRFEIRDRKGKKVAFQGPAYALSADLPDIVRLDKGKVFLKSFPIHELRKTGYYGLKRGVYSIVAVYEVPREDARLFHEFPVWSGSVRSNKIKLIIK